IFSLADGLPEEPVSALAMNRAGTLFVVISFPGAAGRCGASLASSGPTSVVRRCATDKILSGVGVGPEALRSGAAAGGVTGCTAATSLDWAPDSFAGAVSGRIVVESLEAST